MLIMIAIDYCIFTMAKYFSHIYLMKFLQGLYEMGNEQMRLKNAIQVAKPGAEWGLTIKLF